MDLSFSRLSPLPGASVRVTLPVELAVLMVGVVGRQAASATARAQATIGDARAVPTAARGAFCAATAAALRGWKGE